MDQRLACQRRPEGSAVMDQTWADLLFLHWEFDPDLIRKRLPPGVHLDLFEQKAYLGVVPFFMKNIRPKGLPCIPWLSNFLELNVRTYVHDDKGRPGVWFFSLDCDQPIAVEIARKLFHLPYQHARMNAGEVYRCQRRGVSETAEYSYQGTGKLETAEPGTLEFFLLERYLLFSQRRNGNLYCGQVHHQPYQFCEAEVTQWTDAPLRWEYFEVDGNPISQLYSPGVPVEIFPLSKLEK
ncbi:MAG: YqjF family protein [Akkermansiaceae bacterium]